VRLVVEVADRELALRAPTAPPVREAALVGAPDAGDASAGGHTARARAGLAFAAARDEDERVCAGRPAGGPSDPRSRRVTTETPIRAPFIDGDPLTLRLDLGACRLRVRTGGSDPWVEGTYTDPTDDSPVRLQVGTARLTIGQDRSFAGTVGLFRGAPNCELRLGTARPYRLELVTGASDVELDLGGLPLLGLDCKAGAGKLVVRVDRPNPVEADEVALQMGAGALETAGLGNLAARRLDAESGAAGMALDLTGELRRHLEARVSAGMSGVRITVPGDRPARITTEATLGGTDLGDGFRTHEGTVRTLPEGEPVVTLRASVALGGLSLRTSPPA
jgi:hypothetical protein